MDTLSEPRRSDTFHPFAPTSYKNKAEFCNVLIPVLIQHFDLKPELTNVHTVGASRFTPLHPSYKNKAEFCNVLIPVLIQLFDLKPESQMSSGIFTTCVYARGLRPLVQGV
jgi:hypothetical protein